MKSIHVSIGEIKLGRPGDMLWTNLGSCIGIAILHKKKNLYGLAHCMLPDSIDTHHLPGKYIVNAIPTLLEMMEIQGAEKKEIEVLVVGGGNMTHAIDLATKKLIGEVNAQCAFDTCKKEGLKITFKDVEGDYGRKLILNCFDGSYEIVQIPRISNQAV